MHAAPDQEQQRRNDDASAEEHEAGAGGRLPCLIGHLLQVEVIEQCFPRQMRNADRDDAGPQSQEHQPGRLAAVRIRPPQQRNDRRRTSPQSSKPEPFEHDIFPFRI